MTAALNTMIKGVIDNVFQNKYLPSMEVSRDATYKKVTHGSFNPSTGAVTNSSSDVAVKIIQKAFDSVPEGVSQGLSDVTGATDVGISETFLDFIVQPVTGVLPDQGHDDKIVVSNKTYNVVSVTSINLGPDSLLYRIRTTGG